LPDVVSAVGGTKQAATTPGRPWHGTQVTKPKEMNVSATILVKKDCFTMVLP
jgi:hypothetical protein